MLCVKHLEQCLALNTWSSNISDYSHYCYCYFSISKYSSVVPLFPFPHVLRPHQRSLDSAWSPTKSVSRPRSGQGEPVQACPPQLCGTGVFLFFLRLLSAAPAEPAAAASAAATHSRRGRVSSGFLLNPEISFFCKLRKVTGPFLGPGPCWGSRFTSGYLLSTPSVPGLHPGPGNRTLPKTEVKTLSSRSIAGRGATHK